MTDFGRLYVCAVPIGNLEDASPRVRRVLGAVDAIACEDTRMTRRLLGLLGVDPVPRLLAHHEHNERAGADGIVALLLAGADIALVSDAGTPVVSDPGSALVEAAHAAGIEVVAVAGPSAVSAAVSVAGFTGTGYRFVGFLPRSSAKVAELARRHAGEILVAFESPSRAAASLAAIAGEQPERRVAICRELTKMHEQVVRGTAGDVAERFATEPVRGEVVFVLDAMVDAPDEGVDMAHVDFVRALEAEGVRKKTATRLVAEHLGGSARALYDATLD